jgi:hypothetical protein
MAYAIKNSTTIILPRWHVLLDELELKSRIMPRDVTTRWNSTYDMLEFALAFREALDTITSEKEMKLRKYEIDEQEWEIAGQLCEVLKVSLGLVIPSVSYHALCRCSRMQHRFSRETEFRTWRPSFPPWTALRKFSQRMLLTNGSLYQSGQL